MKVKDLISKEIDIDIVEDVTDDFAIAFVGPIHLTVAGLKEFSDVLNYEVEVDEDNALATVMIDYPIDEVWEHRLSRMQDFFNAVAGFCSDANYKLWFVDDDPDRFDR